MYRFHAPASRNLTCRHWLLSPVGCFDRKCPYAHTMTGVVAPPSSIPCFSHEKGGCRYEQDECLLTHRQITYQGHQFGLHRESRSAMSIHIRKITYVSTDPQLASEDIPIAEAAATAGFDISSWPKLNNLINAVRSAALPSQSNFWSVPAAWTLKVPPERLHAEQKRACKGVAQSYKDTDRAHQAATVPAFVVPAHELIDKTRRETQEGDRVSSLGAKRGQSDVLDVQNSHKRLKIETSSQTPGPNDARISSYVDLTQPEPAKNSAHTKSTERTALGNISNNVHRPPPGKHAAKKQRKRERERERERREEEDRNKGNERQQEQYQQPPIVQESRAANDGNRGQQTAILNTRVAARLHSIAAELDADRDALRQQWEEDDELKHPDVTRDLAELNDCFGHAQDAVMDGIAIIHQRLLNRHLSSLDDI